MPLYEYLCEACGARFELIRKFADPPLEACPTCGAGPVQKLVSSPAFQFKGSGWYVTDYARKSGGGEGKSDNKPSSSASGETPSTSTSGSSSSDTSGSKDSAEAKPAASPTPMSTKGSKSD